MLPHRPPKLLTCVCKHKQKTITTTAAIVVVVVVVAAAAAVMVVVVSRCKKIKNQAHLRYSLLH